MTRSIGRVLSGWAGAVAASGLMALAAGSALAAGQAVSPPVVVELFTSQGCSSCPPANANLATVSDRPGVLALSFGVTYWDYLGWKDSFARPEFTTRQYNYERTLRRGSAYTPQMVVNGARSGRQRSRRARGRHRRGNSAGSGACDQPRRQCRVDRRS